ncbi:MAG TPA: hypothetical protein VN154_07825, partial [Rhizomicrobium sp.]|nr:hypothetical protein [Rhizomicrobium sp.]
PDVLIFVPVAFTTRLDAASPRNRRFRPLRIPAIAFHAPSSIRKAFGAKLQWMKSVYPGATSPDFPRVN